MHDIDPLAVWGAVLSTLLLLVRIFELWKSRSRIEVSYSFSGIPEEGYAVIVRNLASTPIMITYWELLWRRRRWFPLKPSREISPQWEFDEITVAGHASTRLEITGMDHFESSASLDKDKIYLRLRLAGKWRPLLRKVFG